MSAERVMLARVVEEYSSPGELVAGVMCGFGDVVVEAARAGRRAVGVDLDPVRVCHAQAHVAGSRPPEQRHGLAVVPGDARRMGETLGQVRGVVDLVVVEPPAPGVQPMLPHPVGLRPGHLGVLHGQDYEDALGEVLAECAELARPGGRVVVVWPRHGAASAGGGALVVRAALGAGLVYVQHVIALLTPICGQALGPGIAARGELGEHTAHAAASVHFPVHDDVLVFTTPAPGVGAAEVGA